MDLRHPRVIQLLARLPSSYFGVASNCLMTLFNLNRQSHSKPKGILFEIILLLPDKPPVVLCVDTNETKHVEHQKYEHDLGISLTSFFRGRIIDSNGDFLHLHLLVATISSHTLASENKLIAEIENLRQSNRFVNPVSLTMTSEKFKCISQCIHNMIRRKVVLVKEFSDKLMIVTPGFTMDDQLTQRHLFVRKEDMCLVEDGHCHPIAESDEKSVDYNRNGFHSRRKDKKLRHLDGARSSGYDTDNSDTSEEEDGSTKIQDEREMFHKLVRDYKDKHECKVLDFHVNYAATTASVQYSSEKRELLCSLACKVSSLRNGNGGVILFHIAGKSVGDKCLYYVNNFVCNTLSYMIQDNDLFTKVYNTECLSKLGNVMELKVTKSEKLCTSDFKTRTRNDCQNKRPTLSQLVMFLRNRPEQTSNRRLPKIRGIPNDLQELQESRHIELKSFKPKIHPVDTTELVNYIWTDLKLRLCVTSMSKIDGGGSVYIGISEISRTRESNTKTKVLSVDGFELHATQEEVKEQLLKKFKSETIVLNRNGTFDPPPSDLIQIEFHTVLKDKTVLEVAIGYYCGIVFYDKDGPEAYLDHEGNLTRMPKEKWSDKFMLIVNSQKC